MSADFTLRVEIPPIHIHLHTHDADHECVMAAIRDLKETVVSSKEELIAELNSVRAELEATTATNEKAHTEIVAAVELNTATIATLTQKVADLEAVIAAGGGDTPPDVQEAFAGVKTAAAAAKASADKLDALNPG